MKFPDMIHDWNKLVLPSQGASQVSSKSPLGISNRPGDNPLRFPYGRMIHPRFLSHAVHSSITRSSHPKTSCLLVATASKLPDPLEAVHFLHRFRISSASCPKDWRKIFLQSPAIQRISSHSLRPMRSHVFMTLFGKDSDCPKLYKASL